MFQQSYASHDINTHSPIVIIAQCDSFEGHTCQEKNLDQLFMIIVIPFPNYFARPSFRSFALKDLKSGSAKYSKNILRSKNLFMKIKMWDKFLMGSKVDPNVSIRHV